MSDDFKTVDTGTMDLENITGLEFLCQVADMCDKAPADYDSFLDVDFKDTFGTFRTMRLIQLKTELEFHPTLH